MSNRVLLFLVVASCCVSLKLAMASCGAMLPFILILAASGAAVHTMWLFVAQEIDLRSCRRTMLERLLVASQDADNGVRSLSLSVAGRRLQLVADLPYANLPYASLSSANLISPDLVSANISSPNVAFKASAWLPKISVLVPAKNEEAVIERAVRQLFKLDYPDYEVIVVDDASSDNMLCVLRRLQNEFRQLHVLTLSNGHPAGKSYVLNQGLELCQGEVIAVFDADAFIQPNFLRLMVAELEPLDIAAVQAQKRISNAQHSLLTQWQDFEYAFDTSLQSGRNGIGGVAELRGNGLLVKMSALRSVGGWNNESITDDLDLTMRLLARGWRVKFNSRAVVWEEGITHASGLLRQRIRWAEGSIRRFLDYMFPLFRSGVLTKRQRLDLIGFMIEFVWPFLTAVAILTEMGNAFSGEQTSLRLLSAPLAMGGLGVTAFVFWSLRTHRPPMSVGKAAINATSTSAYFFVLWCPCILIGLLKILFQRRTSAWALTEHRGHCH